MKPLLLDQNLSPHLVNRLADAFPGCVHVQAIGFGLALDRAVWDYAREHDYTIVSKDADFSEMSLLLGLPPKVIWIRRGNCSTNDIEELLRENRDAINALSDDPDAGILTLY
jgi:predicted nuclease of predicted toxin-antitoxin system